MATTDELKERIDLHDLAQKLDLKRPKSGGNYRSPHHTDKGASLSIKENYWKDFSADQGGSCIDLVMYVKGLEVSDAINYLHELYGFERSASSRDRRPQSQEEWIASKCHGSDDKLRDYLRGRGISDSAIDTAIKRQTIGFNTWVSDKVASGEFGHGGPAPAFFVRSFLDNQIVAVDMRYLDPDLNGGVKTQTHGPKLGFIWTADYRALLKAHTIAIFESPINALSADSIAPHGMVSIATRGVNGLDAIDWRFCQGKKVLICMDNDEEHDHGKRAGQEASWRIHELLTTQNVACFLVDQSSWLEPYYNDFNDLLQGEGIDAISALAKLKEIQPWIIPGVNGEYTTGRNRLWLPGHDSAQYWRFRVKEDFTTFIKEKKEKDGGGHEFSYIDVCGFRVAGISRVKIQGANATMTGEEDVQPRTLFAVSVQAPRHGNELQRRVMEDDRLHNVNHWGKFGPIFAVPQFLRMINMMERGAHLGAREAMNFVGIGWKNKKLEINQGPDCYFTDPDKQCPYHNLMFPSGSTRDARTVIEAYQHTFDQNAATILLSWALGGHLKVVLGFWPHMVMQASKGAGKSTLVKRMESTIGFTMFSGQSLQTEFRLLTSISHTSHPVGWEEISARRQDVIDKAVSMLQESYQFGLTRRGSDMTEYLQCAPVLLAGEDVPVKSMLGKVVRTDLSNKKGTPLPHKLPKFPVLEWLKFICGHNAEQLRSFHESSRSYCTKHSRSDASDDGANRMIENYACLLTSWRLLCDFISLPMDQGDFTHDLMEEMNRFVSESHAERQPWVWILETVFSEISSGQFRHPFRFVKYANQEDPQDCLLIRPSHIMQHFQNTIALRDKWNALPVKTDRVLKQQLVSAGVCFKPRVDAVINSRKESHLIALSLNSLAEYSLYPSVPEDIGISMESDDLPPMVGGSYF